MLRSRFCFLPQLFPGDEPWGPPFFQKSQLRLHFYPCYPRKRPHSQKSSQKLTAPVEDNCKSFNPVCPSFSRSSQPLEFVEIQATKLRAVVQTEPRGYLIITAQNPKPGFTGNHVVRRLRRHLYYKEGLSRQQEQTLELPRCSLTRTVNQRRHMHQMGSWGFSIQKYASRLRDPNGLFGNRQKHSILFYNVPGGGTAPRQQSGYHFPFSNSHEFLFLVEILRIADLGGFGPQER